MKLLLYIFTLLLLSFFGLSFTKTVTAQGALHCYVDSFNTCVKDPMVNPNPNCAAGYVPDNCAGYPDCCQYQNTVGTCNNVSCLPQGQTPTFTPTVTPTPSVVNQCTSDGGSCKPACSAVEIHPSLSCTGYPPGQQTCCKPLPPGSLVTCSTLSGSNGCKMACDPTKEFPLSALNDCQAKSPPQQCCLQPSNLPHEETKLPDIFCLGNDPDQRTNDPLTGKIASAIGCIEFIAHQGMAEFFLKWGLGVGGGIAFILIVYAGFIITTSSGDPHRLQGGRELLNSALSGLLLLVMAAFLLRIIGVDILVLPGF